MIGRRNGVIGLIVFLGGISHAYAQDNLDDRVAELVRESALRVGHMSQGPGFDLTLDDAIQRALDRNLDIAVSRINPLVVDLTLAQQQAFYRPTVSFDYNTTSVTTPSSTQLDGGVFTVTDQARYNTAFDQPVKWGGGSLNVGFDNNRRESSSFFQSFNPSFSSIFSASYTQPLLRGFKTDNNRQQIQITQINRDISDVDLRQTITNTVADVQNAYWELLYTVASVAVQRQALELAEQLVRDNRARVEIGTLAPIDIVQAQSEAASRRQTLAAAQQALRSAELTLKRLIVNGTRDELWTAELNPVDEPQRSQPPVDIEAALRNALAERTDLKRAERQQDINELTINGLKNTRLPALDLTGQYQLQGQGGDLLIRSGFLGGPVNQIIEGGYSDALNQIVDADFPLWSVGLRLTYPLGTSADDVALRRARLQLTRTEAELRQLELNVATEVTNAALQLASIQERIAAATAAREFAEQQLSAEESRFEVGLATNFFVVQAQRDLATAQETELRAILDYQLALIEFERVQKTSLGGAGISIVGGGG